MLAVALCCIGRAATVVTIGVDGTLAERVRLAAAFYGLEVRELNLSQLETRRIPQWLADSDLVAAVASVDSLSRLNRNFVLSTLRRARGAGVPLLLVDSGSASEALSLWTRGAISKCIARDTRSAAAVVRFTASEVTGPLAGVELPLRNSASCGLLIKQGAGNRVLAEVRAQADPFPVFVEVDVPGQPLFVVANLSSSTEMVARGPNQLANQFSELASVMMFLRSSAREKAWHPPAQYANLTVDDPWIREPYGNLNYADLLAQMEIHNFHTTVAFIPWNFDRSEPAAVALFRRAPERLSIAVHGNNHNHREFERYDEAQRAGQRASLNQALARMESFTQRTGLPYDRVMVFPHAISPAGTLSLLKELNYWATTNSENVPLGSTAPGDSMFALRPQTLAFNNFLSIKRVSAEVRVSRSNLAINAFLGNPLLLYVHQEFFSKSAGAFNPLADYINAIAPDTEWKSLGHIVQHLYLQRLRTDGDYDVATVSPYFSLMNPTANAVVFHVSKAENREPTILSLLVNGQAQGYHSTKDAISFAVRVPAGERRSVKLTYGSQTELIQVDLSKTELSVRLLRLLSDFRDIVLSTHAAGRAVISFNSQVGFASPSLALLIGLLAALGIRARHRNTKVVRREVTLAERNSSPDIQQHHS